MMKKVPSLGSHSVGGGTFGNMQRRNNMLESQILEQVKGYFAALSSAYTFEMACRKDHPKRQELMDFLNDMASTSPQLSVTTRETDVALYEFSLLKDGKKTGIKFRGIPNGHEFTSLLLAILNADGKGKNLPDEMIGRRIASVKGEIKLQTYVSLTCTNCPDVVQALNVMALQNPRISHEMIDGALFEEEVENLHIQGVPAVYLNGEPFHTGRGTLGELLQKLEDAMGTEEGGEQESIEREYDVIVIGGGPAGSASAIYSARKGLRVAVVAETIGGQVNETVGIENLISVPKTTGAQLSGGMKNHLADYPIDVYENRKITEVVLQGKRKAVHARGGEVFYAPAVVIATGASWRRLNVEGEKQYMGHGVHFCPHCDGPFYKGKRVAVIGGGNSGIEAAIDLSGICSHVTVLEFADTLRADTVLQEKAAQLGNIEIFTSSQTTRVLGDETKVTGLQVKDRKTDMEREIVLDGIFVQIGLSPNTELFRDQVSLSERGEVNIDAFCRTSLPGVYAAGDVTTVPYKQIVVAMGEGAKAALSAFEDRMRGVL